MGLLNGRADTREEYERVWKAHIADMTTLMYAAGLSSEEMEYHSTQMRGWLKRAADHQKFEEKP